MTNAIAEGEAAPHIPQTERKRIKKFLRRISRRNALRKVLDAKTGDFTGAAGALPLLLRVLQKSNETDWRRRTAALIALRQLPVPPESETEIAAVLGKIMNGSDAGHLRRGYLRGIRFGWRWLVALSPILLAIVVSGLLEERSYHLELFIEFYLPFFMLYTFGLPFASPIYDAVRAADVRIEAAKTLAALQLPASVGALARAARGVNFRADIARNALLQLLPTLTEAHYGQLGADATPELCALLTTVQYDTPYLERLLTALGNIGDGRAVLPVEKVAADYPTLSAGKQAAAILPVLRARRQQANHSRMLLRHASAPPAEAGQLLRAASATSTTPPEQLLRPSEE